MAAQAVPWVYAAEVAAHAVAPLALAPVAPARAARRSARVPMVASWRRGAAVGVGTAGAGARGAPLEQREAAPGDLAMPRAARPVAVVLVC